LESWHLPMLPQRPLPRLAEMSEIHSVLDRLEVRLDYQAERIDALYRTLEENGLLPHGEDASADDELFDELLQVEDAPLARSGTH
jgi:hypothetical protein